MVIRLGQAHTGNIQVDLGFEKSRELLAEPDAEVKVTDSRNK